MDKHSFGSSGQNSTDTEMTLTHSETSFMRSGTPRTFYTQSQSTYFSYDPDIFDEGEIHEV